MNERALHQLKENANWYLALGIGLILVGTFALVYAFTSTIVSMLYLGAVLVIGGIFEGIKSFKLNKWSNFLLHLLLSVLYVAAGVFIIMYPGLNALTLTLILAGFFIASGIARIYFGLSKPMPHKGWVVFNGIVTLILGILIWYQWPVSGLWVIGMLVGIDMIFTGWTWIYLSTAAKKLP